MKKIIAVFLLVCGLAFSVSAEVNDFPQLTGQVVDTAGVLTPQTKALLQKMLSVDKDNQVVVAVVKNLNGQEGRSYGLELARHWRLGQKGKDNGVLILLAVDDRYTGIEVGYGLEGVLPDSVTGRIIREQILPPLQQNLNYNQAMLNGAGAVMNILSGGELPEAEEDNLTAEDLLSLFFMLLMLYLYLSGKGPRGGGISFNGGSGRGGGGFFGGGGSFGGGGAGRRF